MMARNSADRPASRPALRPAVRPADRQIPFVKVVEISPTQVTLDANHPPAGRDLTFKIKLVEVA